MRLLGQEKLQRNQFTFRDLLCVSNYLLEERRLFFVGMTRAKNYLELSYYTNPDQVRVSPGESRYLQMIPSELVKDEQRQRTESITGGKVDLQKMRKEVEKSPAMQTLAALFGADLPKVTEQCLRKVRHEKYGIGIVISEDDNIIEAEFENYGKKQFMKMFSELEDVQ